MFGTDDGGRILLEVALVVGIVHSNMTVGSVADSAIGKEDDDNDDNDDNKDSLDTIGRRLVQA